ncbi:hypothetical protein F5Y14DRAFT_454934 [Nemania sp. NC0429]|nr:hypothetical protein F5Y14DRAFT_454934 [Nemania sp. NC0429]
MGLFKSTSSAGRSRLGPPPRSSIRNQISRPIPLSDEEFPMRSHGPNIAQEGGPKQLDLPMQRESATTSTNMALNVAREGQSGSLAQSGSNQSSNPSTPERNTTLSGTRRYSSASEATDGASLSRKKSTFRVVIGKLFGKRNRKQDGPLMTQSGALVDPPRDVRSDPTAKEREQPNSEGEPKRSASFPVAELPRPLRSHSIGPDDYMAIQSARDSFQSESVSPRPRAATASDGPISPRLRDGSLDICGLSPRPATAQGHDTVDEHDPDSIGRALSVDFLASRRRSRSLSQLNDVPEERGLARKRSEEIRYWRESYNPAPLSPGLSASNRDEPGKTEPTLVAPDTIPLADEPAPLNFGLEATVNTTQAISLEERLATLELRNQGLEKLVSQLFQAVRGIDRDSDPRRQPAPPTTDVATSPAALETATRQNVPLDVSPLSPTYGTTEQRGVSFKDEQIFVESSHSSTGEASRPLSNATIRDATSAPAFPRDASSASATGHYDTLKLLLDTERAARHALESRVAELTQIVDSLSRANRGTFLGGFATVSTFEHDDDDDDEGMEPLSASIEDSSDVFETPWEERPIAGYHILDEDDQGEIDDDARKRAARALSLGQLTLGKSKRTQQPGAGVDL